MAAYYNEIDTFAAEWLRNLIARGMIAPGDVDTRSIVDVRPDDVRPYTQCHFFAGIGGWSYALRSAGWKDSHPVWTGSCPCQPFSSAARGRNRGMEDDRDLWPVWRNLIAAVSPRVVFGEQVAQSEDWQVRLCDDMEVLGYEVGAAVLPVIAVGADHARPRFYFVGHSDSHSKPSGQIDAEASWLSRDQGQSGRMVQKDGLPARMAVFRGFGNAIHPALAAEFIVAAGEAMRASAPLPQKLGEAP